MIQFEEERQPSTFQVCSLIGMNVAPSLMTLYVTQNVDSLSFLSLSLPIYPFFHDIVYETMHVYITDHIW